MLDLNWLCDEYKDYVQVDRVKLLCNSLKIIDHTRNSELLETAENLIDVFNLPYKARNYIKEDNERFKHKVKQITKSITRKFGFKIVLKQVTPNNPAKVVKGMSKGISKGNIVSVAADAAQTYLEYEGYEKTGKAVGAAGNIATGILFGGAAGGPIGAALGGAGGFLVWGTGELFGAIVDAYVNN